VLQQAAREGLSASEAQRVARGVRVEAKILGIYGTEEEQEARNERHVQQEANDEEQRRWNYLAESPCAKNMLRHIKVDKHDWRRLWKDVERGALGAGHMPYVENQLRKHAEFLINLADDLKIKREALIHE